MAWEWWWSQEDLGVFSSSITWVLGMKLIQLDGKVFTH